MKHRYTYTVNYQLNHYASEEQSVDVVAESKADAYDKAVFEVIPAKHGKTPYGAYVASVTYANGNSRRFNTSIGLPY